MNHAEIGPFGHGEDVGRQVLNRSIVQMILPDGLGRVEGREIPQRIEGEQRNAGPSVKSVPSISRLKTAQDQIFGQWLQFDQVIDFEKVLLCGMGKES